MGVGSAYPPNLQASLHYEKNDETYVKYDEDEVYFENSRKTFIKNSLDRCTLDTFIASAERADPSWTIRLCLLHLQNPYKEIDSVDQHHKLDQNIEKRRYVEKQELAPAKDLIRG